MPAINSKAIKDYSSGDLISRSEPLVHVIHYMYKQKRCDNCYAFQPLKMCSKCNQMFYCDISCQRSDWIYHKNECQLFARHGSDIARVGNREPFETWDERTGYNSESKPIERLLLRLLLLLKNNELIASKAYQLVYNSVLIFNDIEMSDKLIKMDEKSQQFFYYLVQRFKSFGIEFSNKLLFRLYYITVRFSIVNEMYLSDKVLLIRQMQTNVKSFEFVPYVCCGIFIPLISHSHSCSPNTTRVLNRNIVELRAIQPIERGEEITVGLIDLTENRENRQKYLRDHYLIDCHCNRCETHWDKDFDFDQLKDGLCRLLALNIRNDMKSIDEVIQLLETIIELKQVIVSRTHPTLILHYLSLFEMKLTYMYACYDFKTDSKQIHLLIELIFKTIRISYGTEHPLINTLNNFIKQSIGDSLSLHS